MITEHNLADLDTLIRQFFKIEDITYGSPKQPFVVRYRGSLITPTVQQASIGSLKLCNLTNSSLFFVMKMEARYFC